jgi:S1-C subfamily serine protease
MPIPPAPAARGGGAGIAIAIAILGVLVSAVVGGLAGYAGARFYTPPATSLPSTAQVAKTIANSSQEPVAAAAAVALPSVVNIDVTGSSSTSGTLPQGHPDVPSGGTGSGVAYKAAPGGGTYVITNNHVVADSDKIVVTPADGEQVNATLVGTDPETDIAVVKVPSKLPTIVVADSEDLVVGQTVIAIGSPFGLQHSVSSGVVSALHRSITSPLTDSTGSANPLVDAIQTDAAINPGNSGGALVDRQGRLVGINSAIYTDSGSSAGVGFSIPSKTVVRIADELIAGGKATHPFLGIEGRTVTDAVAKQAGLAKAEGASIESVIAGTGAAKAGLRKGDIVTALDSTPIRTMDDLILAVRRSQVGDTVTLTVWRDKASVQIKMTIGDKPASVS